MGTDVRPGPEMTAIRQTQGPWNAGVAGGGGRTQPQRSEDGLARSRPAHRPFDRRTGRGGHAGGYWTGKRIGFVGF